MLKFPEGGGWGKNRMTCPSKPWNFLSLSFKAIEHSLGFQQCKKTRLNLTNDLHIIFDHCYKINIWNKVAIKEKANTSQKWIKIMMSFI